MIVQTHSNLYRDQSVISLQSTILIQTIRLKELTKQSLKSTIWKKDHLSSCNLMFLNLYHFLYTYPMTQQLSTEATFFCSAAFSGILWNSIPYSYTRCIPESVDQFRLSLFLTSENGTKQINKIKTFNSTWLQRYLWWPIILIRK